MYAAGVPKKRPKATAMRQLRTLHQGERYVRFLLFDLFGTIRITLS